MNVLAPTKSIPLRPRSTLQEAIIRWGMVHGYNLPQVHFARAVGLHRADLTHIIVGSHQPSARDALAIANELGVEPAELFGYGVRGSAGTVTSR